MGGCSGKSAAQIAAEKKEQQKDAAIKRARSLGITAQFLRNWATLEEVDLDALLAEIKRREGMPPMAITCLLPEEASQEERHITVRGYETVGFSVSRELLGWQSADLATRVHGIDPGGWEPELE